MMDASNPKLKEAFVQLRGSARLSSEEIDSRLEKALSPTYWQQLNPLLSVGEMPPAGIDETKETDFQPTDVLDRLRSEGYFQLDPLVSPTVIGRMREGIEVLKQNQWLPVFAFVYDEFWTIVRTPFLRRLLTEALGPGYKQIGHLWAHYVTPVRGAHGWGPHVDGVTGLEASNRLSIWIPLSDATLDNGCVYLIPQDLIDKSGVTEFSATSTYTLSDLQEFLQNSRAMPARAGSILGWGFQIIHWGSTCARPGNPRISIALEFVGEGAVPVKDEPLVDADLNLPSLPRRLHLIGQAILEYQKFETRAVRYVELARRLLELR